MTKSDPLFNLVKAMTKTEKRYFKLNSTIHQSNGNKDYLRLFDAIDAQKLYNEKAIIQKFKDEPYFRRLKDVKLYLRTQIIKSLRNFHDNDSCHIKLNNYLTEIELLFKKRLYKNCENTIKKAKAYAKKYDSIPHLLRILEFEMGLADYTNDYQQASPLENSTTKEVSESASIFSEYIELRQLYFDSRRLGYINGSPWSSYESSFHSDIIQHPLVQKEWPSFNGELTRQTILLHYEQQTGGRVNVIAGIKNVIKLFEAHPHQMEENINVYFINLIELITTLMMVRKLNEAYQYLLKARSLYAKRQSQLILVCKIKFVIIEAGFLLERGEFSEALDFISVMDALFDENIEEAEYVGHDLYLYMHYLSFYIHFKNKDFKNAQHDIQKVIDSDSNVHQYIHSAMRIANLILQYEQKEYKYMGYILRSTYRFLAKKQRLHEPETIILDFIRKCLKITSERQMLRPLAEFKEQILPYASEPFISDFGLIEWIDSKLQKRELAEIVKEKYAMTIAAEADEK